MGKTLLLVFKKKKLAESLTELFINEAATYNGLYSGIDRIARGQNRKNLRALDEFYKRTGYKKECSEASKLMKPLFPIEKLSEKQLTSFCGVLEYAMRCAGISHSSENQTVALTKDNVMHYQDWNGGELYVGDTVRIVSPAWYQNGKILEKGYCQRNET